MEQFRDYGGDAAKMPGREPVEFVARPSTVTQVAAPAGYISSTEGAKNKFHVFLPQQFAVALERSRIFRRDLPLGPN